MKHQHWISPKLSGVYHPIPSIHPHFFAPCQLKVLAPRSYLLVEHMKIMVFFVIFIYLIHSYGSLIEEFYLKFSIYMLATFLSSKRQAEVVDEK